MGRLVAGFVATAVLAAVEFSFVLLAEGGAWLGSAFAFLFAPFTG